MCFYALRFNLYLLLAVLALTGCKTGKQKQDKHLATLRVHIEDRAQLPDSGLTVPVLRTQPVLISINREPFLTEASILNASLLEVPGGFAIQLKLDNSGTWMLEQFTAANPGRHMVIFSQWGEKAADSRWLAAPIIPHRIANGVLAFTPDCSAEEAKKIVTGLNHMGKKTAKGKMK
jgi:hypothetical protein